MLDIELDDLDPYRDLRGPSAARRLAEAEVARWRDLLTESWRMLATTHTRLAPAIGAGLRSLVPLPTTEPLRTLSASAAEAFGAVALSQPENPVALAATLVHEFQHNKLGALLHAVTLHQGGSTWHYAPWRDDPRPAGGLIQGIYAFAGITEFWRLQRYAPPHAIADLGHFEFALWRRQVLTALTSLAGSGELTPLGDEFIDVLANVAHSWQDEPVPARPASMARLAAADHRALWLGHHRRVDPGAAAAAARAVAGSGVPPESVPAAVLSPATGAGRFDSRATLIRHRLTQPAGFLELTRRPDSVARTVAGAVPADVALIAGNADLARRLYEEMLDGAPERVDAWVGLGLCLADDPTDPAAVALLDRPELVVAVALAARSQGHRPAPIQLARWTGEWLNACNAGAGS
jgi:hypothetical protein